MTYPFVCISNDFKIEVRTDFDFDQSNPLQYHYLFSYTILITNLGLNSAQLLSRKWFIKDATGDVRHVEGPGVIGQTPHFKPGQAFEYSSFCPLPTMTGEMWGYFVMLGDDNQTFRIETPTFKFSIPEDYIDQY